MPSTTPNAVLPTHPAGNVPLDADNKQRLESAKSSYKTREKVGESLSKFLIRMRRDIDTIDREKRLSLFRNMIKAHQYFDGNFYGYVDQNCEWQSRTKQPDEVWYNDNQLAPYLRTALMELSRTQTEVVVEAPPGADERTVNAAKFAKARYDANRDKTFNARLKQTENSFALLNGITFRYTFVQFDGKGRKEQIPVTRSQETESKSASICGMCSRPQVDMPEIGETKGEPVCPSCGSSYFIAADVSESPDVVIDYKNIPNGQNAWIVPNPVGITVSMQATGIEDTPFLDWKQLILRSILEEKYTGIDLPSTGVESTELRYISSQQKTFPASDMSGTNGYESPQDESEGKELEILEFRQTWLDYSLYCSKTFSENMPLGRGKSLKAGQPLGEMFPDGLYFASVGDVVLDIWNEDKNRKWTSSPYGIRAGSMYGAGSVIALSDQEVLNDLETLKMANAWANAVPREFVDPEYIKELSVDPAIPTNMSRSLPDGTSKIIGRAYEQAPSLTLSPEIYAMSEAKSSAMQNKIGAMSGSGAGGLADAQKWGDTATAISIKRDMAVGRFSPDLELMADQLDREQAIQFLENEQEFFTPGQWEKCKGEYGDEALKAFLECDIRNDLLINIAPGSYMPKSDAQVQAKLLQYLEILPTLAQLQNPELIAYVADIFGVPEHLGGWNSDRAAAKRVTEKIEALAEVFVEQYGDIPDTNLENPQVLEVVQKINEYANAPIDTFLDNHDALIDAYRDWRSTDNGRNASNAAIAAVSYRVTVHEMAKAKQAQLLTVGQMVAQEPLMAQQQAQQQEAVAAQESQLQQQQAAQEPLQIAEGMGKVLEFDDRDKQREHEEKLKAAEIANEQVLAAQQSQAAAG